MPVNNTKGLQTNLLLFEDDFEDGSISDWTIVSSGTYATVVSSPAQGSYALKLVNNVDDGAAGFATCTRTINLSSKPRTFQFKFRIVARGIDDPPQMRVRSVGNNNVFSFNPARQDSIDPLRRMRFQGGTYTTLNIGEWYTITATINFNTHTIDFECRDSVNALESSDTGISFAAGANDLNYIEILNQLSDTGTVGEVVYDDFKIWGKGI